MQYTIEPMGGLSVALARGDQIEITDIAGQQVADFFAVCRDGDEFLSTGVTMDINGSVKLGPGGALYTHLYRKMFTVLRDDTGGHDLLYPSCRTEMYDCLYRNGDGHPNCFDNLNRALAALGARGFAEIRPVNLFMRTAIAPDGKVTVERPVSRPGDAVVLRAEMDVIVAIAACSVSESACNGGLCGPIGITIYKEGKD